MDCGRLRNLKRVAMGCVPDLLHYLDRLLGWHVPWVGRLTNECHIRRDERVPEPVGVDPVGKLFIARLFVCFTTDSRL